MSSKSKPKETSFDYGKSYQEDMLVYYQKSKVVSESNTEYLRLALARELVTTHALPRLAPKPPEEITLVDVGCSVGLLAIDFAKRGYRSFGIDFDPAAIEIAARLNSEESAGAEFLQMDVSHLRLGFSFDIALCFDVFEHLRDDEPGALLYGLKRKMSDQGCMVFHTLPLQYDYLFWNASRGIIQFPRLLRAFRNIDPSRFTRLVEAYALCLDLFYMSRGMPTHKESINMSSHCNPLTRERLKDILSRAGYEIISMTTGFLGDIQLESRDRKSFHRQFVTHRSLWGVAAPA